MNEITKILDPNEEILWEGKPANGPFILPVLPVIPVALFITIMFVFIVASFVSAIGSGKKATAISLVLTLVIGAILSILIPFFRYLSCKATHYAITNKRAICQNGLIGRDFQTLDFDKINNTNVEVGLLDKLFGGGTGSVLIDKVGGTTTTNTSWANMTFSHVEDPYEAFKYLKKISYDVKTDIEYPNAMRPKNNPGYNTEIKNQK
jgi:uncharacterized membrane protein YdbT with pleckstrin-like domain